jgi:hypothetical protein
MMRETPVSLLENIMMKSLRNLILTAGLLVVPSTLHAAEAAKEDVAFSSKLVSAIENADYAGFTGDGTDMFKAMTKEQFAAVAAKLGPKLKGRDALTYLGDLKQKGFHVTLWKLTFKDGSDDSLITLSVKDGKVGGFLIQ